ncbi:NAD-dependent epimerase/dehydratase family protein [Streptomyces sp. NPDC056296]|uniref:NAD-dependent epimerase/dehydratase family protein n=1 Tax=Streptomyces sp. NPDC056296 TaxID=3345775 RepID=UPI0035D605DF
MNPVRVVLTGATGFVGSRTVGELLEHPGVELRLVGRTRPAGTADARVRWTPADLTDPASLRGVCRDADVVVHLASLVSGTSEQCRKVNEEGTAALVQDATAAGVRRLVHLSTSAVYGAGPHSGQDVEDLVPAPVSAASTTRLAGEQHTLRAGGLVLRAGLVLGAGDRWVVPALARLLASVPYRWAGGDAELSLVDVSDLVRLIARATLAPLVPGPQVVHASHPRPVRVGDLMETLAELKVLPPWPSEARTWDECLELFAADPGGLSARQFHLLAQDHWYRSDSIWRRAACDPGPGPLARLAGAAEWYRGFLVE